MKSNLATPNAGRNGRLTLSYSDTSGAVAPISTADVKAWAKVETNADDSLIADLINETISQVERKYNFPVISKDVVATWEHFGKVVRLPFYPVSSITTVKEIASDGTQTTLVANQDYYLSGDSLYFEKVYGWESHFDRVRLEVTYVSAYDSVPNELLLGLKKAILSHYEAREDLAGGMTIVELPNSSTKLFKSMMRL